MLKSELHPGYVELMCPFCMAYRHAKVEDVNNQDDRRVWDRGADKIVCDNCWEILLEILKRLAEKYG